MLDVMMIDMRAKDFEIGTKDGFRLEFSQINIIAGANGSGKTFVMKFAWFAGYILQIYKIALQMTPNKVDEVFATNVQKIFGYTFDYSEELTGSVMITDTKEEIYRLVISFKEGKLDYFNIDMINPDKFSIGEIQNIRYNTKDARTFNQYNTYMKLKKRLGITALTEEAVDDICGFFKLYDVMWFENINQRVKEYARDGINGVFDTDEAKALFGSVFARDGSDTSELSLVNIEEDDDLPLFIMSDGSQRKAMSLSSGQQSMLMILMFQ